MSQPDGLLRLLRESTVFRGLPEEDYEELQRGLKLRQFEADAFLFYEDDEGGSAHLILEGSVSIERTVDSSKGYAETVQLAVRGPDELIGEMALLMDQPRTADARALEATKTVQIRGKHFLACAEQSIELAFILIRVLASRVQEAGERLTHVKAENVTDRVLRVLEEEARRHGIKESAGVRILLVVPGRRTSQQELARQACCDRSVFNRTLAALEREGRIVRDADSILILRAPRV